MRISRILSLLLLGLGAPGLLKAQPLRLATALQEADGHAFANRQSVASAAADKARVGAPLKGMLPAARVEAGFVRTTDPIGAFGTTLRQRAISPAAFDPARLNDPTPVNNVAGGVVLEVPVFNGDAIAGWRAAKAAAGVSRAVAEWTATGTRAMVVRAYFGAVLAQEKIAMLTEAERAAGAALDQVASMVRQGLVTKADQLQANVRVSDVTSQLLAARHDAVSARRQLAVLLGRTDTVAVQLPTALPADTVVLSFAQRELTVDLSTVKPTDRSDLRAAQQGVRAAWADRQRAAATLLPRVNGFARYDYNSSATLFAGKPNWTVGVMGSWSLFGGGSELADIAGATARLQGAQAGADAATAQAQLDLAMSRRDVQLAIQQLALATDAAAQSREAHRLVEKRYAGGLATIAEMLGAQSTATGAALAHAAARHTLIDALAQFRRARGADPGALSQLEQSATLTHTDLPNGESSI